MGIGRKESKPYHLLVYCESCSLKLKKFESLRAIKTFITKFKNKHPDLERSGDNWIDFAVYNISGPTDILDPSVKMAD